MEIILLERVEKLGQMGEIVSVKAGFARNYLVPQGKALRATKSNREVFEQRRAQLEASNLKHREQAEELRGKVDGVGVTVIRQAGEGGQLYGSVNARDIAEAFVEDGITFDRRQVRLDAPLKALGIHQVQVALHPEVDVQVLVNVARSQEEAETQADPELAAARVAEQQAEQEAARDELAGMGLEFEEPTRPA
jgi:large subunit ribosomal protein L9